MTPDAFGRLPGGGSFRRALSLLFVGLAVLTLLSAGHSYLNYDPVTVEGAAAAPGDANASDGAGAGPASPATGPPRVVATVDGVGPGQLVAYDANGSVVYRNESWWIYHDVDPVPEGEHTVSYVASDTADADTCEADRCLRNAIERVNLTTGETTRVHAWTDGRSGSTQTHDVDRINESVYLVGDISYPDRVYMVNVTSGEEIWEWRVAEAFDRDSGGSYPGDWTHLNDVEYLPDGRVMVNLRNQDQVVFLEPGSGIQRNWTLGADGDHDVLFEAHNPDYIPEARGGPAVVVADSENNRLVEYQRENRSWERSWHWQDTTLQWPRDADRLPSGRTLVADSHGQRILSVAPDGSIAWSHEFPTGSYDVELLGTGDESAGGHSAAALGLASRYPASLVDDGDTSMENATVGPSLDEDGANRASANGTTPSDGGTPANGSTSAANSTSTGTGGPTLGASVGLLVHGVVDLAPPLVVHGLLYALPTWATPIDAVLLLGTGVVGACWLVAAVGVRLVPRLRDARGE